MSGSKIGVAMALRQIEDGDSDAAACTLRSILRQDNSCFCLIYRSRSRVNDDGLHDIVQHAAAFNQVSGISGVLFECEGIFLQVLEGEESSVRDLFRRIEKDPRHCHVIPLVATVQEKRFFGGWNMASAKINKPTYEDFVQRVYRGKTEVDLLLQAFLQDGKFR